VNQPAGHQKVGRSAPWILGRECETARIGIRPDQVVLPFL